MTRCPRSAVTVALLLAATACASEPPEPTPSPSPARTLSAECSAVPRLPGRTPPPGSGTASKPPATTEATVPPEGVFVGPPGYTRG